MSPKDPDLIQLRQAVDASGEVMFITDPEGTITFVNAEFERMYGYSASEVLGRTTPRLLKSGQTSPEEYADFRRRLRTGQIVRTEFVNRTRSGMLVRLEVSANPIRNEAGVITGYLSVQRDVTNRRAAEQALQESEARYRSSPKPLTTKSSSSMRAVGWSTGTVPPRDAWIGSRPRSRDLPHRPSLRANRHEAVAPRAACD